MELDPIKDFGDMFAFAQRYRKGSWVFRGEANIDWKTRPRVGRPPAETHNERRIFGHFVREAPAVEPNLPASEWELLALAQHHGLPTRLLDWTENPLAALFFACLSSPETDGAIFALKTSSVIRDESVSPFEVTTLARYRPRHITSRIHAQRGLFTVHPDPEKPLALADRGEVRVHRAPLRHEAKTEMLWTLSRFGISMSSLFPDLDGLARHICWAYSNTDPTRSPSIA